MCIQLWRMVDMLIELLYRIQKTILFVMFRTFFYTACDWIQMLFQLNAPAWAINGVGQLLGARWALRQCFRLSPGWFPTKDEIRRIRLL